MILENRNRSKYYHEDEKEPTVFYEQLDSKIDNITKPLEKTWSKNLRNMISVENADTICNYIIDMKTEINPTTNYITDSIKLPYLLSKYLKNKPSDMWTQEDDLFFCRYCPSKRDKAYHMIARDTSARPHEILRLKIKSVIWNRTPDGKIYANVLVNGKTGSRSLLLTDSIPYLKDYLNTEHPMPNTTESPLICAAGKGLGRHLKPIALNHIYSSYRRRVFPNILKNNDISEEDKHKLQNLLSKPWNPYVRRHSSLTQKSKILKEHTLRQYAGWTANSGMPQKYVHYFGDEANQDLLVAYGILPKDEAVDTTLRSKYCPNCNSPNQPEQHYCMSCGFVLTFTGYSKLMEEQKKKQDQLEMMEERFNNMQSQMQSLLTILGSINQPEGKQEIAKQLIEQGMYKPPA